MILQLVDFSLFVFLVPFGFWIRYRVADSTNARVIFFHCQSSALVALAVGLSYAFASSGNVSTALFFARLAASMAAGGVLLVAMLACTFPYEKRILPLRAIVLAAWLAVSYLVLFTDGYLAGIAVPAGLFSRIPGSAYWAVSSATFGVGLLSALALLVRRLFFASKIHKLQAGMVGAGLVIGFALAWALAVALPGRVLQEWTWALSPIGAAVLSIVLVYGVTITRLFDVRAAAGAAVAFVVYIVALAAAAGAGFALSREVLAPFGYLALAAGAAAVFLAGAWLASFFQRRYARLLRSIGAYGEKLEQSLSDIDFSRGRDYVIETVLGLLAENVGCSAVNLLIENASGEMANVGSSNGLSAVFERKSPGIDLLLNDDVSILLKTEVLTNYEYHDVKEELLAVMERFNADALVLLREGRSIIGALLVGSKRTGGEFTDYDFDVLSRVYGKIFVVAYYLKNVAQESLVLTVDRELEYSEQVIQSIQENIDRIEHPAVDISYMTKSTRKLGGDFIDFIRLSPDRFIFVIGDVSGKGLNASMSMVILKSVVRTFLKETKDFKKLVVKTNSFIKANLPRGTFFAGVFGLFDFRERSLYYVNCGVPAMLLLSSAYNNPVEIQGEGKVLGFVKDIAPHVSVRKAAFKQGDALLVTTDGLTDSESLRGVRFGKERIAASLQENRSQSADRIVRYLAESVEEFVGQDLNDDITILTVKFL